MSVPTRVRVERPQDVDAIDLVLRDAFPGAEEANLVRTLRRDGALALSLVADRGGEILGHVAFETLTIDPEQAMPCWALAPLAVRAAHQGQGIGGVLVREGLSRATQAGVGFVAVLGEPDYYARFGFQASLAAGLDVPWRGPHFMGLLLRGGDAPRGRAIYPDAFSDPG